MFFLKIFAFIASVVGCMLTCVNEGWDEEKNVKARKACYFGLACLVVGAVLFHFVMESPEGDFLVLFLGMTALFVLIRLAWVKHYGWKKEKEVANKTEVFSFEDLERREDRAEKLARIFGGASIVSLVGMLLFMVLAFVFHQYLSKLIALGALCAFAFYILKSCEFHFESEWLMLSARSFVHFFTELDRIEKDLEALGVSMEQKAQ